MLNDVKKNEPNQMLYEEILSSPIHSLNISYPEFTRTPSIIVLVVSTPDEFSVRQDIRATWANFAHSEAVKNGSIATIFLMGGSNKEVSQESSEHRDVLMVNVEDSYENLVFKELAAFRWLHFFYPDSAVVKADSDVIVHLDRLYSLVRHHTFKKAWISCRFNTNARPERNPRKKWYVPYSVQPSNRFPDYCNGPIYAMSPSALQRILRQASKAKVFQVEDAFFTGVLAIQAGIQLLNQHNMMYFKPPSKVCSTANPNGTIISYPLHKERDITGIRQAFAEFQSMKCKTLWQRIVHIVKPDP